MFDALVVGLGAMGSATLAELAARGARVIGVDAFDPPHALGSTHGRSRIIREAYYEHPSYVPLVRRAQECWDELARATGLTLFHRTGGLNIGAAGSGLVRGALASAERHGLAVELLDGKEVTSRFPAYSVPHDMVGVFERNAGVLLPEQCIRAYLGLARKRGADVRPHTTVRRVARTAAAIEAHTDDGVIAARRLVLCAGAWSAPLLEQLDIALPLTVARQTMHWLEPAGDAVVRSPERMPVALVEHAPDRLFYCLPDLGNGVKAAVHHEGESTNAASVDRTVHSSDIAPVEALAARFLARVRGKVRESIVCLYTNTPDRDFAIGVPNGLPHVAVVSACSGHGFKFASAIGEAVAQLALGETCSADLSHFRLDRFDPLA
ncbi:MAG: N-methyl-L-tryptophan oxidase [bacterium]